MAAKTGTRHHHAKLNPRLVTEMRERYAEGGTSFLGIACEFDIAESTAREAIRGRTWRAVPYPAIHDCANCKGTGRVRGA